MTIISFESIKKASQTEYRLIKLLDLSEYYIQFKVRGRVWVTYPLQFSDRTMAQKVMEMLLLLDQKPESFVVLKEHLRKD